MTDRIQTLRLSAENKREFIEILEKELLRSFNTTSEELPENYGYSKPWSLLNMISNGEIDFYQLIFVNEKFWAGSGGIVREFEGKKCYQSGFRAFASTRSIDKGIGSKSYSHEINTKEQILRAIELDCSSVILSFNEHNKKLFEITHKYHLRKVFGKDNKFLAYDTLVEFNGVPQWLIVMCLK